MLLSAFFFLHVEKHTICTDMNKVYVCRVETIYGHQGPPPPLYRTLCLCQKFIILWASYLTYWHFLLTWLLFLHSLMAELTFVSSFKPYHNTNMLLSTNKDKSATLQKQVVCFNQRVVTLVADKLKRQWLWVVHSWYLKLIAQGIPIGSCPVHLTTTIHWQPSEHLWRSHYKCSSKLQ